MSIENHTCGGYILMGKNWDLNVVMSESVFPNSSTLLNISFLYQLVYW